jgi:penicillin-binding protein 1C
VLGIFLIWFAFALPNPLFKSSYTTILLDKNKQLLGAKIAKDGQWRFPENDSVPYKFQQAVINFEDAYFYKHPGVNPVSLTKALWQDIKAGKIV